MEILHEDSALEINTKPILFDVDNTAPGSTEEGGRSLMATYDPNGRRVMLPHMGL